MLLEPEPTNEFDPEAITIKVFPLDHAVAANITGASVGKGLSMQLLGAFESHCPTLRGMQIDRIL